MGSRLNTIGAAIIDADKGYETGADVTIITLRIIRLITSAALA